MNRSLSLLGLPFLVFVGFLAGSMRTATAQETYTCNIVTYRDHADSTGYWTVREESGTRLTLHVGTSQQGVLGDRFDEVHMRVHGRLRSGAARFLRSVGDWQAALKSAEDACREWRLKGQQQTRVEQPPPQPARPPRLAEMVVEQRHLAFDRAQLRIAARVEYEHIGQYQRGDILLTLRVRDQSGQLILTREFRPGAGPELRPDGNRLFLTLLHDITEPGDYSISVTIADARFSSGAHSRVSYEDTLRAQVRVSRPAAVIRQVTGIVNVTRINPAAAAAGVRVQAGGRRVEPAVSNSLQAGPSPAGEWRVDPFGEDSGLAVNPYLYEGDQVSLWGLADRSTLSSRTRLERDSRADLEELKRHLRSGMSTVDLEWPGGASGTAIWQPALAGYTTHGRFTIGATRETSGRWQEKWADAVPGAFQFLFEQGMDYVRDKAILWFLKVGVGGVSSFVTAFNLSTGGGQEWDELIYVKLNSEVLIRPGQGGFELFTFEGRPEILSTNSGSRVVVNAGRMATATPAGVSPPRPFEPAELLPAEPPVKDADGPIDLGLADSLMSGLMTRLQAADIPSLQARVTGVSFYEAGQTLPPMEQRRFATRFSSAATRYVWWDLNLAYPEPGRRIDFQVQSNVYRPDGTILTQLTNSYFLEPSWTSSSHSKAFGSQTPGSWSPGVYRVDLFVAGAKVASGSFEVAP